jgi:hypothetical protein
MSRYLSVGLVSALIAGVIELIVWTAF